MNLFDTNIIIESAKRPELLELMKKGGVISDLVRLETLGYHDITDQQEAFFNKLFGQLEIIPVSKEVIDKAIELRQVRKSKVADCIIAATALLHKATLYTRNVDDFNKWPDITIINPIDN